MFAPDRSQYDTYARPRDALQRADQIIDFESDAGTEGSAPLVADMDAGFGGALYVFELKR